jgi:hypothetical protein
MSAGCRSGRVTPSCLQRSRIKNVADVLTQAVPNNVTSEMGLALLDVADAIRPHPEVVAFLENVDDDGFLDVLPRMSISLDGFAIGEGQSLAAPFGHAGAARDGARRVGARRRREREAGTDVRARARVALAPQLPQR